MRALAVLVLALPLFALDPTRPLDLYSLDVWRDGLPQYTVRTIVQTRDGYLWFGTFEGLVRFNGLTFEVFDPQNTPAMTSARVRALSEDRDGSLWIGTEGGDLIRYRDGAFTSVAKMKQVLTILESRDGTLWIGTTAGLARYREGRLTTIPTGAAVQSLAESDDTLWVGTDRGLFRFDRKRFTPAGTWKSAITSLAVSRDGSLWVGTFADGLFRVSSSIERLSVPASYVAQVLEDSRGTVWIAASPGGLIRLRDGQVLDKPQGLPNSSVRALLEDREGCLWIGTNGGLARLRDLKFINYSARNGLADDNVRVVTESRDGGLWVGTYGGGVNLIRDGKVTSYGPAEGLDVYVRTFVEDRDGALWVGTSQGLSRIRDGKVTTWPSPKIDAIHVLRDGTLLVSSSRGLQAWRNERFEPYLDAAGDVRVIHEDAHGTLWLGTSDRGLLECGGHAAAFSMPNGRLTGKAAAWPPHSKCKTWPVSSSVFALHEDARGELWIGTHDGLLVMRGGSIHDTAIDSVVFQILDDGRGHFWLTSNRGLTRVDRNTIEKQPRLLSFRKADGLGSDQCNGATQPAGVSLRNGHLAIPTVAGLTIVDPADLHLNRVPPGIVLREVLVDGKRGHSSRFPWSSSRYEFHYDGLSLLAPEAVRFRHRIEGFDEDWIDAGTRRVALYNSLPPGRHVFHVAAINNDGVWSTSNATFTFDLPAAPWRRWWAIALYVLAAIALILAGVRTRERVLRRRTELLEAKVHERTLELEEAEGRALDANRAKSVFLANMSHELRTPLNAVLGFAQLMARSPSLNEKDRESLAVIRRGGEHLLALINDVLSISKIEAGKLALDKQPFDLRAMLSDVAELMRGRADAAGLDLFVHVAPDVPPGVLGDERKLRQVLTNLIGNALKFTRAGSVAVRASWSADRAELEVSDTGAGIAEEELATLFEPFVQTETGREAKEGSGLGLAITRQLVELMGGTIRVTSEVGAGTTFRFTVDLPSATPPVARRESKQILGLAPGEPPRRIAVVDDTVENRVLLCSLLESTGFDVRAATNGQEAVELWKSWHPDLIFMDQRMPVMDGSAATRDIRESDAKTVIIAVTASVFEHEREAVLSHGANDFVMKPYTEEKIFEMLMRHLDVRFRYRGGNRVLLVDDDAINRQVARGILTHLGYEITEARGGVEALAHLDASAFDVVLLDLEMPELDGRATVREIRTRPRFRDLPVIAMTAHDRDTARVEGMTDYLAKPLEEQQVVEVLRRAGAQGARNIGRSSAYRRP